VITMATHKAWDLLQKVEAVAMKIAAVRLVSAETLGQNLSPMDRAYRMFRYYLMMTTEAPEDREAERILDALTTHLGPIKCMPGKDEFPALALWALREQEWETWRRHVVRTLELSDRYASVDDELAIARRVYEARRFDLDEITQAIHDGDIPYGTFVSRLRETHASDVQLWRTLKERGPYRLSQQWYRRDPPLLTKERPNVYIPTEHFIALFDEEPERLDPPVFLETAGGGD